MTGIDSVECGERYTLQDHGEVVVENLRMDLRAFFSPDHMEDSARVYFTLDGGEDTWLTLDEFMRQVR